MKEDNKCNNIVDWCAENEKYFVPPVCNKCMFEKQLKVFFVGGPNQRKDFHLEEGEEFFYQLKNKMNLKLIVHGAVQDLEIPEGYMFMLPSKMEHSPQRFENSLGLVVERERKETEFDCVRYFNSNECNEILFERWFHLKDVVKDLPPLINCFMESVEHKTNKIGDQSFLCKEKFKVIKQDIQKPLNLKAFIEGHKSELELGKEVVIYGAPKYKTKVVLFGEGSHLLGKLEKKETLIIMVKGTGYFDNILRKEDDIMIFKPHRECDFFINPEGVAMSIVM
uniref:3-hydroxyanthranilate 3,4-dioxygenase n=1 Tax=Rhabditophanes sp. KR3021 TaxID=114890 RepID=A0AC35U2H2_9BILA